VPVSTTIKPVTHNADVAVNNLSTNESGAPLYEIGKVKRIVPKVIPAIKL